MSIESVMLSKQLILSPFAFNLSQSQGLFHCVSSSPVSQLFVSGGQKLSWSFNFSNSPSNENSGLISFRIDCFDLAQLLEKPLTIRTFVCKVISLLFNMLFRSVIAFLPRRKVSFNLVAAVTVHSNFAVQENKVCHCFHIFPIYLPWSDETRGHDLKFFECLSFKPTFSLSSFTFIKRLFSSSSFSAIRLVLSAYIRLLIFLPAILIPASA